MPRGVVRLKMPYGGGSTCKDIEPRFSSWTMHEHDMLALSLFCETKLQSQNTVIIIQAQMKQEWQNVGNCGSWVKDSWGVGPLCYTVYFL